MKIRANFVFLITLVTARAFDRQHYFIGSYPCDKYPAPSCYLSINTTSLDSCCVEKVGLFLLSQFWDVNAGYDDRWSVHGLWNNFCDNTFACYCDPAREFRNITELLISRRAFRLVQDMNNNWPNSEGHVDELWSHEWNKHGVCMSTFEPPCYQKHDILQGMIDYFNTTMHLYHKHDIYKALERHGVVPGHAYSTALIQTIIQQEFNMLPDLRCNALGHLEEVWIYFYVRGPVKRMDLVFTHNQKATNCNTTLTYPTKYPDDPTGTIV